MMFLAPIGGFISDKFGILTTPGHKSAPIGIKAGMVWAADNQAFTRSFDIEKYQEWLKTMELYKKTCLFVAVPDVIGDARATLELWEQYHTHPMYAGWKLAFVAQDGQEDLPFPDGFDTLFIGGTTRWKLSEYAHDCILRAQSMGKHIHIGRVNYFRRYQHFAAMNGSQEFTCDGTRTRFDKNTIQAWESYMASPRQPGLFVSGSDCVS